MRTVAFREKIWLTAIASERALVILVLRLIGAACLLTVFLSSASCTKANPVIRSISSGGSGTSNNSFTPNPNAGFTSGGQRIQNNNGAATTMYFVLGAPVTGDATQGSVRMTSSSTGVVGAP